MPHWILKKPDNMDDMWSSIITRNTGIALSVICLAPSITRTQKCWSLQMWSQTTEKASCYNQCNYWGNKEWQWWYSSDMCNGSYSRELSSCMWECKLSMERSFSAYPWREVWWNAKHWVQGKWIIKRELGIHILNRQMLFTEGACGLCSEELISKLVSEITINEASCADTLKV